MTHTRTLGQGDVRVLDGDRELVGCPVVLDPLGRPVDCDIDRGGVGVRRGIGGIVGSALPSPPLPDHLRQGSNEVATPSGSRRVTAGSKRADRRRRPRQCPGETLDSVLNDDTARLGVPHQGMAVGQDLRSPHAVRPPPGPRRRSPPRCRATGVGHARNSRALPDRRQPPARPHRTTRRMPQHVRSRKARRRPTLPPVRRPGLTLATARCWRHWRFRPARHQACRWTKCSCVRGSRIPRRSWPRRSVRTPSPNPPSGYDAALGRRGALAARHLGDGRPRPRRAVQHDADSRTVRRSGHPRRPSPVRMGCGGRARGAHVAAMDEGIGRACRRVRSRPYL